jgi:hypothetical protein
MQELMSPIAQQVLQETIDKTIGKVFENNLDKYLDSNFYKQNEFIKDPSRFIVAQCSRRAGKTNGLALRFFHTLETHPGSFCLYIALTRESAKNIMWGILQEKNDYYKLNCRFIESTLTMIHPNGARLQLFGADMKNFIKRLKGIKTPGVAIDEAQDFGSHLQVLIDDVLTPTLTDYEDSWIAITGTPGPIPVGYFYELTVGKTKGFSHHEWTLYENPYLPQAKAFVDDLKIKRSWSEDHPTLRREWYNEWVLDPSSLLIKYEKGKNHYEFLPQYKTSWIYILGIDLGFKDKDALCVLAWSEATRDIYLVYEYESSNNDISTLIENISRISKLYDISKMVIDTGGLGKKIAEEITRRHHFPLQPADKARKMENIALLNDYLRLGNFKAKSTSQFAQDSYRVQIDYEKTTPDRIVLKSGFHSDIIDAVLYAFKESPAFTYKTPDPVFKYGSKEWADQEARNMEDKAIDYFQQQEDDIQYVG